MKTLDRTVEYNGGHIFLRQIYPSEEISTLAQVENIPAIARNIRCSHLMHRIKTVQCFRTVRED